MSLKTFQPERPISIRGQISNHLRELILQGELEPGSRVPTAAQLAREWSTHSATVHAALTPLVKEGLLYRQRGVGTFVRDSRPKLQTVAVYLVGVRLHGYESGFVQALSEALCDALREAGLEPLQVSDQRRDQTEPMKQLVELAETGAIQGVIVPVCNRSILSWLSALPVPVSAVSSCNTLIPRLHFNYPQFTKLAIQSLVSQGCKTVGMLSPLPLQTENVDGSVHEHVLFYENYREQLRAAGLAYRPEWCIAQPREKGHAYPQSLELLGYHMFGHLWSLPEKPEGLIIANDLIARGCIMRMLELGLRVPEDLRLVIASNAELGILCPWQVDLVQLSLHETAIALVDMIIRQYAGKSVSPHGMSYRLVQMEPVPASPSWLKQTPAHGGPS